MFIEENMFTRILTKSGTVAKTWLASGGFRAWLSKGSIAALKC